MKLTVNTLFNYIVCCVELIGWCVLLHCKTPDILGSCFLFALGVCKFDRLVSIYIVILQKVLFTENTSSLQVRSNLTNKIVPDAYFD